MSSDRNIQKVRQRRCIATEHEDIMSPTRTTTVKAESDVRQGSAHGKYRLQASIILPDKGTPEMGN